jgi:hypothetical protein
MRILLDVLFFERVVNSFDIKNGKTHPYEKLASKKNYVINDELSKAEGLDSGESLNHLDCLSGPRIIVSHGNRDL